jgi:hypothetical protein
MSKPRAISLLLMTAGVCADGTAPDCSQRSQVSSGWRQLYLQIGDTSGLRWLDGMIDRAILLTALAVVATIFLFRVIGSNWL